jgi:hypothetical protein
MFAMARLGVLTILCIATAGCGGGDPAPQAEASTAATEVPTTTKRVYLATALACSKVDEQKARFTPLRVESDTFATTVKPVEDCAERRIFNSYVFDVPVPDSGEVRITPGNQPTAVLDVARLAASGVVTVYYARKGEARFEVSSTEYKKTEDVQDAA